ncbi:MAG: ribose 5-phosphate isomerase B [Bacteroidales bacterium]|nr:ribose 5-phosphate isomerase B [Bacteroidales bacterium]
MIDKKDKIVIASDHAGYELKEKVKQQLEKDGYQFDDMGTVSEESVDYPDFAHKLGKAVNDGVYKRGIVMCGSGQGVSMTVNKYENVRGALCWNAEQAELSRRHNDANVIALPGRFIDGSEAVEAVKKFMNTGFEGGRHQRRVEKISKKG